MTPQHDIHKFTMQIIVHFAILQFWIYMLQPISKQRRIFIISLKPPQILQYKSNNNFTVNHVNNHFMKHLHNVTSSCALTNCPSLNVVDIGNTNIELVYQSNIWNRLIISVGICYAIKCGTFLGCSVRPLKWQIEG